MGSKEGMVTVPVMLLLFDRTFVGGSFREALRTRWRTHAAIAATWLVLAGLMLTSKLAERGVGFGLGQSAYSYALTEIQAIARYVQLTFWPHSLVFDYGPAYLHRFADALPSAVALTIALAFTLVALRRWPMAGFTAVWFFVLLAPTSSVIPIIQQPCAENRVYLPLAGPMVLIATLAWRAGGSRGLAAMSIVVVALGAMTFTRNPAFGSDLSIWWDTTQRNPGNERAFNNLGNAFLKAGRFPDAVRSFEQAIHLSPNYADALNNLGVTMLRRGLHEQALQRFRAAAERKTGYADAHYNAGEVLIHLGRAQEATVELQKAARLQPRNAKVFNNLGVALLDAGNVQASLEAARRAVRLSPGMAEAHYNLGNALSRAGQTEAALAEYEAALRLSPGFARAHNNAGVMLMQLGRNREAAERLETALRLDPNYADARANLDLVRNRL